MGQPWDKRDFPSWLRALAAGQLTPEQLRTLDVMVEAGEAEDRKAAAARLDWQDTIIDPDEHMYGF